MSIQDILLGSQESDRADGILAQTLNKLPAGPIRARKPGVIFPPQEEIYTKMESLIHHFMLVVEGLKPPVGEVYQCIESPQRGIGSVSD